MREVATNRVPELLALSPTTAGGVCRARRHVAVPRAWSLYFSGVGCDLQARFSRGSSDRQAAFRRCMPRCWTRHRKNTCMRPHPSSGGTRASAVSLGLQVSVQVRLCLGCWRLCLPARQRRRGGAARAAAPSRATRCSRKALSGGTTCRRRPDALPDSPAAAAALLPIAAASLPLQLGASAARCLLPSPPASCPLSRTWIECASLFLAGVLPIHLNAHRVAAARSGVPQWSFGPPPPQRCECSRLSRGALAHHGPLFGVAAVLSPLC